MPVSLQKMLRVQKAGRLTVVEFNDEIENLNFEKAEVEVLRIIRNTHCDKLAFDLSGVDYLTSAVVNYFVDLLRYVKILAVFNPSDFNLELLQSLNLDSVIHVAHGWQSDLYAGGEDSFNEHESDCTESEPSGDPALQELHAEPLVVQPAVVASSDVREHVVNQIREFEASLESGDEMLICFGTEPAFAVRRITFRGDHVFVFDGVTADGKSIEKIQHFSQVDFNLLTGKREGDDSTERPPIQILWKSFPSAQAVVHD